MRNTFLKLKNILAAGILVAVMIGYGTFARAAYTPLAVSIFPPVQFPSSDFNVALLRVSALWGEHRNVYGFDLAAGGNVTDGKFGGMALSGLFNYNRGQSTVIGLQAAGLTNVTLQQLSVYGVQVAGGLNINEAEAMVAGVQLAPLGNYSPFTTVGGAQLGLFNTAHRVYGIQIGVVNVCDDLHGVQIGLVNVNHGGPFEVSPILNVGF